ncbi:MAG: hypothetical protein K0S14_707, partial [Thermomicrobiales bacterium]|nr:hypothetical protein [Thermomicrobiales bacterium]
MSRPGTFSPTALPASDVGRSGGLAPFLQGVSRQVGAHPLAKTPHAPDWYVPKLDCGRDRPIAVVKMDNRAPDTRKVHLGDDCSGD